MTQKQKGTQRMRERERERERERVFVSKRYKKNKLKNSFPTSPKYKTLFS